LERLITIGLSLFFVCITYAQISTETQSRIEASATQWILNKVLDLPDSYKPGEFNEQELIIGLSPDAVEAKNKWINTEIDLLKSLLKDTTNDLSQARFDSLRITTKTLQDRYNSFTQEPIGYAIKHNFRAKNKVGEALFYKAEFKMDNNFNILSTTIRERKTSNKKTG